MERRHLSIRCPKCSSDRLRPLGVSGALSNFGSQQFGLVGRFLAGSFDKPGYDPKIHEDIEYKCLACNEKFFVLKRYNADHNDFEAPFTVTFFREKKFVGAAVPQVVFLNGYSVGVVKNGQAIQFSTNKLNNEIVVTDHNGMAFPDYLPFVANEGGSMNVKFALKFEKQ